MTSLPLKLTQKSTTDIPWAKFYRRNRPSVGSPRSLSSRFWSVFFSRTRWPWNIEIRGRQALQLFVRENDGFFARDRWFFSLVSKKRWMRWINARIMKTHWSTWINVSCWNRITFHSTISVRNYICTCAIFKVHVWTCRKVSSTCTPPRLHPAVETIWAEYPMPININPSRFHKHQQIGRICSITTRSLSCVTLPASLFTIKNYSWKRWASSATVRVCSPHYPFKSTGTVPTEAANGWSSVRLI